MKVAFLTSSADPNKGSTRVRVSGYLDYFRRAGIATRVLPRHNLSSKLRHLLYVARAVAFAAWSDVVVIQKPNQSRRLIDVISRLNRRLWVDIDDAVWALPRTIPVNESTIAAHDRLADRVWYAIRHSERAVLGSRFLAGKVRSVIPDAHVDVLPSSVDLSAYPMPKTHVLRAPATIGWIGSAGNLVDLDVAAPALQGGAELGQFRLRVVSSERPRLPFDFDYEPWSLEREAELLYSFDIGIMPLHTDERSLGRCGYKAVQYMAAGLPVVCSPAGSGSEVVVDGQTGFHATDQEQWLRSLADLAANPELRCRFGELGRQRVAEEYSLQRNSLRYVQMLKTLGA